MKNLCKLFILAFVMISVLLTGCDALFGEAGSATQYNDKMESATGKWLNMDDEDTYFLFDGSENVMSFHYYEDGALKHSGKFRGVINDDPDDPIPLTFVVKRNDKPEEDWIHCYTENVTQGFTQFRISYTEEDLGMTDGTVYTHIYRISEFPYKIGTYVLEGKEYKPFSKTGFDDGIYRIPEGTYVNESGQSLTVLPLIRQSYMLFQYTNGDTVVEGIFNIATDKKTIYLYIENDIYEKVRLADKDRYDTSVSLYYPPDFYLRGDFDTSSNSLVINDLYHHTYSPTKIEDAFWTFGTYDKK